MFTASPNSSRHSQHRSAAVAFVLLGTATALGLYFEDQLSLTSLAMLYVLAVVIAAYTLRWLHSVIFAVVAVSALNFFFVPPRGTFQVDSRENLISLLVMLLVALVISHLVEALRCETDRAQRHARRAHQLQELATQLAAASSAAQVANLGQNLLERAFTGPVHVVLAQADGLLAEDTGIDSGERDGLRCCMRENAVLGPGTGRWPGLNAWYLPLGDSEHMGGAVCVHNVAAADQDGREHAQAICALLAQTLLRLSLHSDMLEAQHESQRQQVQSTFLAAISHDLRTPLAAMLGAATSLQTQADKLSTAERERLLDAIVREAGYLSSVTENTLQLVRLSNAPAIARDWESMEEIVGAVLARARRRDVQRRIQAKVPPGLPLLRADAVLLSQLIDNLLDNALKYSSEKIELVVTANDRQMQVQVKDRGPEIAADQAERIFKPYFRDDHSGQRGAGLGLALCRAIAQAHQGQLMLRRRQGGGNSFVLTLPLAATQPQGSAA